MRGDDWSTESTESTEDAEEAEATEGRRHRKDARVTNRMLLRRLGNSGISVSAMGAWLYGDVGVLWPTSRRSPVDGHFRTSASTPGVTFLDTATTDGPFTNELVGRFVRSRRDQVVVATKFGNRRAPDGSFLGVSGQPDYVRQCCDASLKRLGVETWRRDGKGLRPRNCSPATSTATAIIEEIASTTVVEPGDAVTVNRYGHLVMKLNSAP